MAFICKKNVPKSTKLIFAYQSSVYWTGKESFYIWKEIKRRSTKKPLPLRGGRDLDNARQRLRGPAQAGKARGLFLSFFLSIPFWPLLCLPRLAYIVKLSMLYECLLLPAAPHSILHLLFLLPLYFSLVLSQKFSHSNHRVVRIKWELWLKTQEP